MNNFNANWKEYLLEDDFDKSKLMIKDKLNEKLWENGQLKEEVALKLMEIAQDFYESLQDEIKGLPNFEDVTFTGSLASYNYHNLSDIDLHLRVDFEKITESVTEFNSFNSNPYDQLNAYVEIQTKVSIELGNSLREAFYQFREILTQSKMTCVRF